VRGQPHPQQQRGVVVALEMGDRVVGRVEGEMLVDVDEARQQRDVA
jgi:hypothetical protein